MRPRPLLPIFISLSIAAVGAASTAHAGDLPVCKGKHKRPANLYGSVLSAGLTPAIAQGIAADPKGVAPVAFKDPAKPQQVSRLTMRAAFAPCGKAEG